MKKSFLAVFLLVTTMSGGAFAFDAIFRPHPRPHHPPPPPPPRPHYPHHPVHGPGHGPIRPGPHHGRW